MQPHRRAPCAPRASSGGEAAVPASGGVPAGWDLANRVSGDAMAMLAAGELIPAEIILKKGEGPLQDGWLPCAAAAPEENEGARQRCGAASVPPRAPAAARSGASR